ncbi:membrane protein [Thermosipho affectus]|uniref:Membrane protein n=1 Tax=Thermosipho affectus TaxID=660294 RepID=A0ABX3IFT7_9BACT|nr:MULTISPECIES: hypothetical protein [Thermosipho]ANQ54246.1 membrane protein [Thermosipho sp. 1070]APT72691.1 membrane protein [Thermosipho sp. 1063]ONN26687.1 membrane protein [Thermosipho affectus]OOC42084.1 membrane protein [Thermosipho sp. 1074]
MKKIRAEALVFLGILILLFIFVNSYMGVSNFFKTLMLTAHDLLINTVFFIMSIAVITGAFSGLLFEFGVADLIDVLLKPFIKPLYNLPGVAAMGILTTYFSDNPAIIALAKDKRFMKNFEKWQQPLLCNLGTSFGMGLIVSTFMVAQGVRMGINLFPAVLIGNIGALVGSVTSVRIFSFYTKRELGNSSNEKFVSEKYYSSSRHGSIMERFLEALLDGGKSGVDIGIGIIPGVLVISTFVMIITFGPKDPSIGYQGLAYEGIPILPYIGKKIFVILKWLFGFSSPELIAFPLTSLGSTGAALALIPKFIDMNIVTPNDIAVFTAMGMTWSGYLSTHIAMMDELGYRHLTGKAILSHTVGGLVAGIVAHLMYLFM